jgi:hypothetical protein
MRPKHPPAAESGVGEHAARESESAQRHASEGARGERPPQLALRLMVSGPFCFKP